MKNDDAPGLTALLDAYPNIRFIDAVFIDLCGIARGKRLPVADAAKLEAEGALIPRSIYLLDVTGDCLDPLGYGYLDGDPDFTARPVAGRFAPRYHPNGTNGPREGQVLMELTGSGGMICDPRAVLRHVAAQLADKGLTPVVALELEFYLIDKRRNGDGAPRPPRSPATGIPDSATSVYDLKTLDDYRDFLDDLDRMAGLQSVPATAASSEFAPGQFEVNLNHVADPLEAADNGALLRTLVGSVAAAHGFDATFMAKPFAGHSGSGLHIHLSVLDEAGKNIFDDGTEAGSDRFRQAIGGLKASMGEAMAIFAPSVNSYRRQVPNAFVAYNATWGYNNRSVALRVPAGPSRARRIEHRVAGAEANPYLTLAAILAGVLHGLETKADPGPPAAADTGADPRDGSLSGTIDAALAALRQGTILKRFFPAGYLDLYGAVKQTELEKLRGTITRQEYAFYL